MFVCQSGTCSLAKTTMPRSLECLRAVIVLNLCLRLGEQDAHGGRDGFSRAMMAKDRMAQGLIREEHKRASRGSR